ncbi:SPOSA6832_01409 [Sporobolomyces salmonicolor]|uniref:Glycine cleavage system H protein n=1 Tax=Sporidiobolus salmonicolor TaxID=5005 RepID=A0A0D6EIH7_SPOSA|nr:SPOSA6832_01409 [Sporobolomyces salmonicolor]
MLRTALRPASRALVLPRARAIQSPWLRTVVTKRYTPEHEWVAYDDATGLGTIGITEYAQKALGDVVYVELPVAGTPVAAGEQIGAVESVKAASDIFAPVGGQVKEVNEALADSPDLLNKSAESDGKSPFSPDDLLCWLAKIQMSNPGEFNELLSADAYKVHCSGGEESS